MENFIDEVRDEPNKMNIKILSQSADTIIAEITPAYKVSVAGTPITANIMNEIKNMLEQSEVNSSNAKATSQQAQSLASSAEQKSTTALTTAQTAQEVAQIAKTQSDETMKQVVEKMGSKVFSSGEYISSFDADTKVNKTEYETNKTTTDESLASLQTQIDELSQSMQTKINEITQVLQEIQTEVANMKAGVSVFSLLKANSIDLV